MWGETPAIGQRVVVSGNLTEMVGVAEDGKFHDPEEAPQPAVYLPVSQSAQTKRFWWCGRGGRRASWRRRSNAR
jgi:hypothetical protein